MGRRETCRAFENKGASHFPPLPEKDNGKSLTHTHFPFPISRLYTFRYRRKWEVGSGKAGNGWKQQRTERAKTPPQCVAIPAREREARRARTRHKRFWAACARFWAACRRFRHADRREVLSEARPLRPSAEVSSGFRLTRKATTAGGSW